jgi:hypothetical protein
VTPETNALKDDITYMRQLAEQGRNGPILGGTFLVAAGLVFGATCFAHWGAITGRLPIPPSQWATLWWGAAALFVAIWFALFYRLRSRPGCKASASNAIFGAAWTGCGIGIMVTTTSLAIAAKVINFPQLLELNPPVVFAFYGAAWFVSALTARRAWMLIVALAAFIVAPVMAMLTANPLQLPAMGAALILTLAVPGFWMMKKEERP